MAASGPVREREQTLLAELDLSLVASTHRLMDPAGHYDRPDVFRLLAAPRPGHR